MLRKDTKKPLTGSLHPQEQAKFEAMATEWRNPGGAYRVVHAFNKTRLAWLFPTLQKFTTLKNLKVLDVGCATGLVSEAFSQKGAHVTGIDVSGRNLAIAQECAERAGLPLTYRLATPEDVAAQTPHAYNLVLTLEVVEHVQNLPLFLNAVFTCARPDGTVVIATLNRTCWSWLIGIVMAEHVLRWLPKGTHAWARFVTPAELDAAAQQQGFQRVAQTGFTFNPLRWQWVTTPSLSVNYMLVYRRQA